MGRQRRRAPATRSRHPTGLIRGAGSALCGNRRAEHPQPRPARHRHGWPGALRSWRPGQNGPRRSVDNTAGLAVLMVAEGSWLVGLSASDTLYISATFALFVGLTLAGVMVQ